MNARFAPLVALVLLLGRPAALHAQILGCSIDATPVGFGNYDVFSPTPSDSTGSVSYSCFLAVSINVRITLSPGGASTYSPRRMTAAGDTLGYNLYRDSARTVVWGDGTGGTSYFQVTVLPLLPTSGTLTVYGRIPELQDARIGSYMDSVVATIIY